MSGYSGTPLSKKLGIKPGTRVKTVSAPADFRDWLAPLPAGAQVSSRLRGNIQIWHIFVHWQRQLGPAIDLALRDLPADSAIWISWPKKSSGVASDMSEDEIRRSAFPRGLVDIKVCAVDDTWSGLKLVIRKENRPSKADVEITIREPGRADNAAILRLNQLAEAETSPLDADALRRLLADSALRLVAVDAERVAGFVIVLPAGRDYASPNYRWFAKRYPRFLYVDRIVIDPDFYGRGLAVRLYQQVFDFARRDSLSDILAEINLKPPNPASLALHRKLGFVEVGQLAHGAAKQVSMQRLALD